MHVSPLISYVCRIYTCLLVHVAAAAARLSCLRVLFSHVKEKVSFFESSLKSEKNQDRLFVIPVARILYNDYNIGSFNRHT